MLLAKVGDCGGWLVLKNIGKINKNAGQVRKSFHKSGIMDFQFYLRNCGLKSLELWNCGCRTWGLCP